MFDKILDVAAGIDNILWGPWTLVFIAAVAVFFTIRSKGFQIRQISLIFKKTFGTIFAGTKTKAKGRMTPFQATSTALALSLIHI